MKTTIKLPPRHKPETGPSPITRPETAMGRSARGYTFFQSLLFVCAGYAVLFAMCATGRAGA